MTMTEVFSKQNIARKTVITAITSAVGTLIITVIGWVWSVENFRTQMQEQLKFGVQKQDIRELEKKIQSIEMSQERERTTRMIVKQITEDVMNDQMDMEVRMRVIEMVTAQQKAPVKPDKIIKVDPDSLMKLHDRLKKSKYRTIDQLIQQRMHANESAK